MVLINGKCQKIVTIAMLGAFLVSTMSDIGYAAEMLPENSVQESLVTKPIQELIPSASIEAVGFSIFDEGVNNINADSLSIRGNLSIDTELHEGNISTAAVDYANLEEAQLDADNEKLALTQQPVIKLRPSVDVTIAENKTDETAITNNNEKSVIKGDMSTKPKKQALKKLMKKYRYSKSNIEAALSCVDWEKRKTTDFAPSFYTIVKNGNLEYFNDFYTRFLYTYVFDEQAMKNVSELIEDMKKYGYEEDYIKYALKYTDWEKRKTTDFSPTFYTMIKNGDLKYFYYINAYKYVFDEQAMQNMPALIEEMKKYEYSKSNIEVALSCIDWEKRKTTDFAQTFYTMMKNGNLKYFNDSDTRFLYKYVFDKQAMQNVSVFIEELEKYEYSVSNIVEVLKYIDWSKATTDIAPLFYTIVKNGNLKYFNYYDDRSLYQYVFDKQAMQNIFELIEEMKQYGFDKENIQYTLIYIDWSKATTDIAPSFYTIIKNGNLKYFNDSDTRFLYQYVFDKQAMKNMSALIDEMKKYGYKEGCIKNALKYTDWEKRKTTDFAPTFYTMMKNGNLEYFNDSDTRFFYQYVFDEQAMKNVSKLIEEMKKYVDESNIKLILEYIDWSKVTTDIAPSFYTIIKNGNLEYFNEFLDYKRSLYKYIFDEQAMKNISEFIEWWKKYGCKEDYIKNALKYINWEKRKTTDFAPTFYTMIKNGYLNYLYNDTYTYEYIFDEQTMKNMPAFIDEMKKYVDGYDLKYALEYIDWSKATTDIAPSFYTIVKNGNLKYFNDSDTRFLYKYIFDEQAMKNISEFIEWLKKYEYKEFSIIDILRYIDWSKATTNISPTFYTMIENGYLNPRDKDTYECIFDEQVMKNVYALINEMEKNGYSKSSIDEALKYIDWKKIKTTDFTPTFYTMIKNGNLKFFSSANAYQYVFDEQVMKNVYALINEMEKNGYSESSIDEALKYIDWKEIKTTDFTPTFYTMIKNGDLKYFSSANAYKYVFDEQAMKNAYALIDEMKKYGYDKKNIQYALKYIDWSKATIDFAPTFLKIIQNGYFKNCVFEVEEDYCKEEVEIVSDIVFDEEKAKMFFNMIEICKKNKYSDKFIKELVIEYKEYKNSVIFNDKNIDEDNKYKTMKDNITQSHRESVRRDVSNLKDTIIEYATYTIGGIIIAPFMIVTAPIWLYFIIFGIDIR